MSEIDAMIPRCSHGKVILGCPNDDCPEQGEYLKKHNQSVQDFLDLQKANTRAFVREYLGLPPEVIIPGPILDLAFERIEKQRRIEEYDRAQNGWGKFLILEDYDD